MLEERVKENSQLTPGCSLSSSETSTYSLFSSSGLGGSGGSSNSICAKGQQHIFNVDG